MNDFLGCKGDPASTLRNLHLENTHHEIELSPVESTLQLRTITGKALEAFGRRTAQLVGSELSLTVSFVIANVDQALIGMDILMPNQLSLIRNSSHQNQSSNKKDTWKWNECMLLWLSLGCSSQGKRLKQLPTLSSSIPAEEVLENWEMKCLDL